MKIKNISTTAGVSISDISAQKNFLEAGVEHDYFESDELMASIKSGCIYLHINAGLLRITGGTSDRIVTYLNTTDAAIQFVTINGSSVDNTYSGVHGTPVRMMIAICNSTAATALTDTLKDDATVRVNIGGGGATGKVIRLINENGTFGAWSNTYVTATFKNGSAGVQVDGTSSGTITGTLSNPSPAGLDITDTFTTTLS